MQIMTASGSGRSKTYVSYGSDPDFTDIRNMYDEKILSLGGGRGGSKSVYKAIHKTAKSFKSNKK